MELSLASLPHALHLLPSRRSPWIPQCQILPASSSSEALKYLGENLTLASSSTSVAGLVFSGTYNGTAGTLTLEEDSILDLGTGSVVLHFADLTNTLAIYNWTGTTLWGGGDGNNPDQFYIDRSLSSSELNRISFHSGGLGSSSFVGTGYQLSGGSFNNEVIPVPEPETYATAVLLLLGIGWWYCRQRKLAGAPNLTRPGE
jgi:hypothetical protein